MKTRMGNGSNLVGRLWLGGVLLLTGGCGHYALVDAGSTTNLTGCCTVMSPQAWSRATSGKREYWTVDGPHLEQVVILKGIEAGEPLFAVAGSGGPSPPTFEAGLTHAGMQHLLEKALFSMGVKPHGFKYLEAPFGGQTGFRMSFAFTGADGLGRLGLLTGTEQQGKLYVLFYHGDGVSHFRRYLPAVEEMIQSWRFEESGWFQGGARSDADRSTETSAPVAPPTPMSVAPASAEAEEVTLQPRAVIPP